MHANQKLRSQEDTALGGRKGETLPDGEPLSFKSLHKLISPSQFYTYFSPLADVPKWLMRIAVATLKAGV